MAADCAVDQSQDSGRANDQRHFNYLVAHFERVREWSRSVGFSGRGDGDCIPFANPGDAGQPICGECARERDFFVMDVSDGALDGQIDPGNAQHDGDGSFGD